MTVGTKDTTTDVTDVTTVTDITALTVSFDQLTPPDPTRRIRAYMQCQTETGYTYGDTYQPFNMYA